VSQLSLKLYKNHGKHGKHHGKHVSCLKSPQTPPTPPTVICSPYRSEVYQRRPLITVLSLTVFILAMRIIKITVRLKVEIHEIQFLKVTNYRTPRNPPPISRNPHAKKRNPIPATKSTATPPKANYRNPPGLDGVCLRMAVLGYVVMSSRPHSTVNAGILQSLYAWRCNFTTLPQCADCPSFSF